GHKQAPAVASDNFHHRQGWAQRTRRSPLPTARRQWTGRKSDARGRSAPSEARAETRSHRDLLPVESARGPLWHEKSAVAAFRNRYGEGWCVLPFACASTRTAVGLG